MNHRVRCPRCGSPRIATGDADAPARYGCLSADDFQSEACILRAKERGSKNLMSETQSILTKYGFAPEPGLRVVG